MTTYSFVLRLDGVPSDHDGFVRFSNAIYSSDVDLSPGVVCGVPEVAFSWEADGLREAVAGAIAHLRRTAPAASVVGVVMEDGRSLDEAFLEAPAPAYSRPAAKTGK
jgi:hypothetical protein